MMKQHPTTTPPKRSTSCLRSLDGAARGEHVVVDQERAP